MSMGRKYTDALNVLATRQHRLNQELFSNITALIQEFKEDTGISVQSVNVELMDSTNSQNARRQYSVNWVTTELEVDTY